MQCDPVCGAELAATAAIQTIYHAQTYVFCSLRCKLAFEDDPPAYTAQEVSTSRTQHALAAAGQTSGVVYFGDALNQFT